MAFQPNPNEFEITIRDESVPRSEVIELLLKLSAQKLTAQDLIAERVRAECDERLFDRLGNKGPELVTPGPKEQLLNGPATQKKRRDPDPQQLIEQAWAAFQSNGFILLIDDRQIESLEEEVNVREDTVVTFLKLTPLVGG